MSLLTAIILVCNIQYTKFTAYDITKELAFVKCVHEVRECVKWNGDLGYCEALLEEL